MTEIIEKEYRPKNLIPGTHIFNRFMNFFEWTGERLKEYDGGYYIPLIREVLEALGFEAVFNTYTSEVYFQRDLDGYRVRVLPVEKRMQLINLQYLYKVLDVECNGLNEMENFFNAFGIEYESLLNQSTIEKIETFGHNTYFKYFEDKEKFFQQHIKIKVEKDDKKEEKQQLND